MFFRILKKALKRKRTMNVIVFLFVILSTMFIASSTNNIYSVMTALDNFFDKAGVPDYTVITMEKTENITAEEAIGDKSLYSSIDTEHMTYLSGKNIEVNGDIAKEITNTVVFLPISDRAMKYYDMDDNEITRINDGEMYVTQKLIKKLGLKGNEEITITIGEKEKSFKLADGLKDALLGSELMGSIRIFVSDSDYNYLVNDNDTAKNLAGKIYYIRTDNIDAVQKNIDESDIGIIFSGPRSMIKMSYIMDMVIAVLLLVVSIVLIIIAFVVLRFTIGFTISEEFREIGVMKAIGIHSFGIRGLYVTKYLALAVAGAVIGFIASIPFGKMLLKLVSQSIMMNNDSTVLINILCSIFVVILIVLFCYRCTKKTDKLSPIDAIRNGQTGERFRKKSVIRLGKSKLGTSSFMAANDILSSPKRFGIIALTFTLCLLLIQVLDTTAGTLGNGQLLTVLAQKECDL